MKAKINENGNLMIERAGVFKSQGCPFSQDAWCGDWCPLFGEFEVTKLKGKVIHCYLPLCHRNIFFEKIDHFIDERKTPGP